MKYPYHFLTVAICLSHPTKWPKQRCKFKPLCNSSLSSPNWSHDHIVYFIIFVGPSTVRTYLEIGLILSSGIQSLLSFTGIMANNNDSSDSKVKRGSCGHFMANWDNHRYCFKCREVSKGDDLVCLKRMLAMCCTL